MLLDLEHNELEVWNKQCLQDAGDCWDRVGSNMRRGYSTADSAHLLGLGWLSCQGVGLHWVEQHMAWHLWESSFMNLKHANYRH